MENINYKEKSLVLKNAAGKINSSAFGNILVHV